MTTRIRHVIALLLACLAASAVMWAPAGAAGPATAPPEREFSIVARVFNRTTTDTGRNVREPVEGVPIAITFEDQEVARGVTGADGTFTAPVAEPGTYTVSVIVDELPAGIVVDDASGVSSDVRVGGGVVIGGNAATTVNFFVGESVRDERSRISLLPQALANGVLLAAIIAITSIGLSLIYATTGLSNFAHGELVTIGAVVAWWFNQSLWTWGLVISAVVGVAATAVGSGALEAGVWRPLRRRGTSLTSMIVVSIGLALSLRYVVQFLFGGSDEFYAIGTQSVVDLGPIELTPRSLAIIGVSFAVLVAVAMFLIKARFGKAIRAVSDNPDLASATGINTDRVILIVWVVGGALAGLGGFMYGLEFGVSWDMGNLLLLLMFAAITLGGLGNPFGALLGSLVVGLFVEVCAWAFTPDLKTVGALIVLIVLLLIRPQGLLGRKERFG